MDPYLSSILAIIQTALEIYKLELDALPPEQRAERAKQQWQDAKDFRAWLQTFTIPKV